MSFLLFNLFIGLPFGLLYYQFKKEKIKRGYININFNKNYELMMKAYLFRLIWVRFEIMWLFNNFFNTLIHIITITIQHIKIHTAIIIYRKLLHLITSYKKGICLLSQR